MSEMLSPQQEAAMLHLLSGKPKGQAARMAGVTPETLSRWLSDEESAFVKLYASRRESVWKAFEAQIAGLVPEALGAITDLMRSEDHHSPEAYNPRVRLDAAAVVLTMAGLLKTGTRVFAPGSQVNLGEQQVNIRGRDNGAD